MVEQYLSRGSLSESLWTIAYGLELQEETKSLCIPITIPFRVTAICSSAWRSDQLMIGSL
jgi:hypothetical protein